MERVGSGAGDDADLRSGALSIFGGVGIGEDIELADSVDPQQFTARATGRDGELARAGVFDAIQQEQIVSGAPSRYGERVAVAGAGVGALHGAIVDGRRVERDQVVKAAAIERQVSQLTLAHQPGDR